MISIVFQYLFKYIIIIPLLLILYLENNKIKVIWFRYLNWGIFLGIFIFLLTLIYHDLTFENNFKTINFVRKIEKKDIKEIIFIKDKTNTTIVSDGTEELILYCLNNLESTFNNKGNTTSTFKIQIKTKNENKIYMKIYQNIQTEYVCDLYVNNDRIGLYKLINFELVLSNVD